MSVMQTCLMVWFIALVFVLLQKYSLISTNEPITSPKSHTQKCQTLTLFASPDQIGLKFSEPVAWPL